MNIGKTFEETGYKKMREAQGSGVTDGLICP